MRACSPRCGRFPKCGVALVKRIIYCSQASYNFPPDGLVGLLRQARASNDRAGVSGMLLYCGRSFLQLLEGDEQALKATYSKIVADERHASLRMLLDAEVAAPLFPDWTMGFDHLDDERLAREVEAFTPAMDYPLLNPDLVINAGVAQTLLLLYARNRIQ